MKRYFSGGPYTGTWREIPEGSRWRVPLTLYDPPEVWVGDHEEVKQFAGSLNNLVDLSMGCGEYELVKPPRHPPYMRWVSEERPHWTSYAPLGPQLDAEISQMLSPGGALLALAVLQLASKDNPWNVARMCEWWFPPGTLHKSLVIHGIHVEYRDVPSPVLVCHAVPSGWRVP